MNRASVSSGNKFFGVIVLSDISGFTKLAEALSLGQTSSQINSNNASDSATTAKTGQTDITTTKPETHAPVAQGMQKGMMQRTGAENLVTIINSIFSRLIEVIHEYGGDVIKFAGVFVSACCLLCSVFVLCGV